jgi:hypothetical protein
VAHLHPPACGISAGTTSLLYDRAAEGNSSKIGRYSSPGSPSTCLRLVAHYAELANSIVGCSRAPGPFGDDRMGFDNKEAVLWVCLPFSSAREQSFNIEV